MSDTRVHQLWDLLMCLRAEYDAMLDIRVFEAKLPDDERLFPDRMFTVREYRVRRLCETIKRRLKWEFAL